jgi:murein tripeptide amidase MpaA
MDWLPPAADWHGDSERWVRPASDPWATPAEQSGFQTTPDVSATIRFLEKLAGQSPWIRLEVIGHSAEGRPIHAVHVRDPETANQTTSGHQPIVVVQSGIHAGEIDGKDAGLMLLRDIVPGQRPEWLHRVHLVWIPILNPDGHEHRSPWNRVNQRGPAEMGWRTTATNLNLNRDYAKLDAPEMRALIAALRRWDPDLYLDIHVTDGEDYQYDITYGFNREWGDSPAAARWLNRFYKPRVDKALTDAGHEPGPLVFGVDKDDFAKGLAGWMASPRFSNGYGDVTHVPTILVENHSLKPYRRRVLGTLVLLRATLQLMAEKGQQLHQLRQEDAQVCPERQVLSWSPDMDRPEKMDFKGIEFRYVTSPITGWKTVEWMGKPKIYRNLPIYWDRKPKVLVRPPKAYWIPAAFRDVIERLRLHGVLVEPSSEAVMVEGWRLHALNPAFAAQPFEGRQRVEATFETRAGTFALPPGSVRVPVCQPLGRLATALLDPRGPDSFFQWGFFNRQLQRTEYIEPYVLRPLADHLLQQDKAMKAEFDRKVAADPDFARDVQAQMAWVYRHTPWYDKAYGVYPVVFEP